MNHEIETYLKENDIFPKGSWWLLSKTEYYRKRKEKYKYSTLKEFLKDYQRYRYNQYLRISRKSA